MASTLSTMPPIISENPAARATLHMESASATPDFMSLMLTALPRRSRASEAVECGGDCRFSEPGGDGHVGCEGRRPAGEKGPEWKAVVPRERVEEGHLDPGARRTLPRHQRLQCLRDRAPRPGVSSEDD